MATTESSPSARSGDRGPVFRLTWRVWAVSIVAWLAVALLFALAVSRDFAGRGQPVSWPSLFAAGAWNSALWAVGSPIIAWLAYRFPPASPRVVRRTAAWTVGGAGWVVGVNLAALMLQRVAQAGAATPFSQLRAQDLVVDAVFFALVAGCGVALNRAHAAEAGRREAEALERRNSELDRLLAEAELRALRARLHPHFLGNTLNAVTALIRTGESARAVTTLARLGALLRRTLEPAAADTILLGEEIDLCREYLDVERARFDDAIALTWDVAEQARAVAVPTFLLQPALENAVIHGVERTDGPRAIHVEAHVNGGALAITIRNTGPGLPADLAARVERGHGVRLTRDRLRSAYGNAATLVIENAEGSSPGTRTPAAAGDAGAPGAARGATGVTVRIRVPVRTAIAPTAPTAPTAPAAPVVPGAVIS